MIPTTRRITPSGVIDIPSSSFRTCSCCEMYAVTKLFKRCSRCKTTSYCSAECQKTHWKLGHKEYCKKIVKSLNHVFDLAIMTEMVAEEEYGIDRETLWDPAHIPVVVREQHNPYFEYISKRVSHMQLIHSADAPAELIVEHCVDIYTIAGGSMYVDKLCEFIFLNYLDQLKGLGTAYCVAKYFMRRGAMQKYVKTLTLPFCNLDEDNDLSESTQALDLTHNLLDKSSATYVALLKLDLYLNTRRLKVLSRLLSVDCTSLVGEFLGVKKASWWQISDPLVYIAQVKEIYSAINSYDKNALKELCRELDSAAAREDYFPEYCCLSTMAFERKFLTYFCNNLKSEMLPVPRNIGLEEDRLDRSIRSRQAFLSDANEQEEMASVYYTLTGRHHSQDQDDTILSPSLISMEIFREEPNQPMLQEQQVDAISALLMQTQTELILAQEYFHRHKYSEPVKALFALMKVDSTKIMPKQGIWSDAWNEGIPRCPEIMQIIKLFSSFEKNTAENLDLCFGKSCRVALSNWIVQEHKHDNYH